MSHIVHVGYHKTGTTWLQRKVFPTVQGAVYANSPVFRLLLRNLVFDDDFMENTLRAALAESENRRLLSYEALVGHPWVPTDPQRTADRLLRIAPGADIVITIRPGPSFVRSLHAQYVYEGGTRDVDSFARQLPNTYMDTKATIRRFEDRFPRVLVLDYDKLRSDPRGFVQSIADFADIRLTVPPASPEVNRSLRGWRLRTLALCNRLFRRSQFNPAPPFPVRGAWVAGPVLKRLGRV